MPGVPGVSWGVGRVLMGEVPLQGLQPRFLEEAPETRTAYRSQYRTLNYPEVRPFRYSTPGHKSQFHFTRISTNTLHSDQTRQKCWKLDLLIGGLVRPE